MLKSTPKFTSGSPSHKFDPPRLSVFTPRPRCTAYSLTDFKPSKTIQSEKDSTDINKILSRYYPNGKLPPANFQPAVPGEDNVKDYTGEYDFRSMLDAVRTANRAFYDLPASLRKRFKTPEDLLYFCSDAQNKDEAVRLGLVEKLNQKNIDLDTNQPPVSTPNSSGADPA